jgi:hypothetical protein
VPDWQAHRQFPRYLIQLPLLHKAIAPASVKAGVGWTRNLSEGGVCVELSERLQPQTALHLLLRTGRGAIELEGQVAWAGEPSGAGGGVLHGLTFVRIAPDQLQALRNLIVSQGRVRFAGVRLPLQLPVTCLRKGGAGPPLAGSTGDISRSGLLLLLPEVLPPGSALDITLHTPNGPLEAEGEVVWAEPPGGRAVGLPFRHGFRFTSLGWATSLSLGLFLAEAA